MINKIELAHDGEDFKFADLQFGAGFPVQWGFANSDGQGGKPPQDAGTLYVTVAHRDDEIYEYGLTVKFTINDLVKDMIHGFNGGDGLIDALHTSDAKNLISRLRDAADLLEKSLRKS